IIPGAYFFFNDTATTEISPLSLHAALPISRRPRPAPPSAGRRHPTPASRWRPGPARRATPRPTAPDRGRTRAARARAETPRETERELPPAARDPGPSAPDG